MFDHKNRVIGVPESKVTGTLEFYFTEQSLFAIIDKYGVQFSHQ